MFSTPLDFFGAMSGFQAVNKRFDVQSLRHTMGGTDPIVCMPCLSLVGLIWLSNRVILHSQVANMSP